MTRPANPAPAPVAATLVAVALAILSGAGACLGQDDVLLREEFLNSAPQAWKEYRAWAAGLQGSYSCKSVYHHKEPVVESTSESVYEIRQRKGCVLLLEQKLIENNKTTGRTIVRASNPQYSFELGKQRADAAWVVTQYARSLTFTGPYAPLVWIEKVLCYPVNCGVQQVYVDNPPLESGFKLLRVSRVAQGGKLLAKVDFDFTPKDKLKAHLRGGWILYDPASHWVQRECKLNVERYVMPQGKFFKGSSVATFEYEERKPGYPLLKRTVLHYALPDRGYTADEYNDFRLEEAEVPESAFTLAAFGLPNPIDAPASPQGTRWYLWLLGAAVICLVLGAYSLRRVQRRKVMSTAENRPAVQGLTNEIAPKA